MVSAAQNYAPYGAPFGTVGTFASPYAYTGEYTDPSGQVYLRARYYNPAIGTFTALDPVMGVAAVPMSLNGYSYVHNNPVNWTDPSGEFLPVIAVIGLGILGGAVGGALLGGGIEAGSQLLNNGFDLGCLDMDSVGRAALEGAALGALAGGVGAAVGAAGLSGAAAFAISEGADFIGGFLYDIGVNGMSREQALINGLMGIGFGGAIGLLGRGLSRAARNINLPNNLRRQCASFSADTLIATPDGDKPISEIEVGDVILAYSEATEEVDLYHVSATHTQRHDSTLDITIDGETLHTTDEHPFYVVRDDQEQWIEAKHLHIGDSVLSGLGETGTVEDIIIIDQPQTMYNLTVSLVATYLVGNGQWVVHNQDDDIYYRFFTESDPTTLLPDVSRSRLIRRSLIHLATQSEGLTRLLANLHGAGAIKQFGISPFVSLGSNMTDLLRSPSAWLQGIIYGASTNEIVTQLPVQQAPSVGEFLLPESKILTPTTDISVRENEILFLGKDLEEYLVKVYDNPYKPDDLLDQLGLPSDTPIYRC